MVTELVTLTYPVVEILKINVTPLKYVFLNNLLKFCNRDNCYSS